jgi:hypothetical protein
VDFLGSLSLNAGFGSLIVSPSHQTLYSSFRAGDYSELEISINDSTINRLLLRDTNVSFVLSLIKN